MRSSREISGRPAVCTSGGQCGCPAAREAAVPVARDPFAVHIMGTMPGIKTYMKLIKHALGELISRKEPTMLKVGDEAPDFSIAAHDGSTVTLSGLRGRKVILWFYPKADTPG